MINMGRRYAERRIITCPKCGNPGGLHLKYQKQTKIINGERVTYPREGRGYGPYYVVYHWQGNGKFIYCNLGTEKNVDPESFVPAVPATSTS